MIEQFEKEHQEVIVHVKCPTKGCCGHTFLSMPEQAADNLECTLCNNVTPAKDWLS